MFRSLMGAALIALALCSCSTIKNLEATVTTITGTTASQKQVAVAVQAFDAVEVTATNYLKLPTCATGVSTVSGTCKKSAVVATLITDVKAGRAARDSLWTASKSATSGVGAVALYTAVMSAVAVINVDLAK